MSKSPLFQVYGPVSLPSNVSEAGLKDFWNRLGIEKDDDRPGCYICATKSKGDSRNDYVPWYVGKTDNSLMKEAFNPRNKRTYKNILEAKKSNRLVMYFIYPKKRKGRTNRSAIDTLEHYLIYKCKAQNNNLINVRRTRSYRLNIVGVATATMKRKSVERVFGKLIGATRPGNELFRKGNASVSLGSSRSRASRRQKK